MEDRGDAEGKMEPAAAIGVEGRSAVDGPQVSRGRGVRTDQGEAVRTLEPGGWSEVERRHREA